MQRLAIEKCQWFPAPKTAQKETAYPIIGILQDTHGINTKDLMHMKISPDINQLTHCIFKTFTINSQCGRINRTSRGAYNNREGVFLSAQVKSQQWLLRRQSDTQLWHHRH